MKTMRQWKNGWIFKVNLHERSWGNQRSWRYQTLKNQSMQEYVIVNRCQLLLSMNVALLKVCVVVIQEFCPVTFVLSNSNVKPRLQVSVIVYDWSSLNFTFSDDWIKAKTKYVPLPAESHCLVVEDKLA